MLENLTKGDILLGLIINGMFTGLGTAIGSYLATIHIIGRVEKLLRKKEKKNEP